MNKKIILIGPAASGKDFLRSKFEHKGYKPDVSYTTRPKREGEEHGIDYNFISEDEFTLRISQNAFYEHVTHGKYRYGTGQYEWDNMDVFIMETDGIAALKPGDRMACFMIYLDVPQIERQMRMIERDWSPEDIQKRLEVDKKKFENFLDYDLKITNSDF